MQTLKEWMSIVRALEDGTQTVLLRKGGILEAPSGFAMPDAEFLLFSTREHQDAAHIREEYRGYLDDSGRGRDADDTQKEGDVVISSYARAVDEADLFEADTVKLLSPFHIWSDVYVKSRMNWMPERPIKAVFLQVYTIPEIAVPLGPEHGGCRSWIDVDMSPGPGTPVLTEDDLRERLELFRGMIR